MVHTFQFFTHVPSKKNSWGRRKNGSVGILSADTKAQIDQLILTARSHWHSRPPLKRAAIRFDFAAPRNRRFDLDNRLQTLLDVLKTARVIHDDNSFCVSELAAARSLASEESVIVSIKELPPWDEAAKGKKP